MNTSGVYAIGDSVMIDAEPSLHSSISGIQINADVGRQAGTGVGIARGLSRQPKVLVFGLGTNGSFSRSMLDDLIDFQDGNALIVVTSHCPHCSWTPGNNAMVHNTCTSSRHCYVADFQALAQQHSTWFVGDGVHMPVGGAGADAYARVVAGALCDAHAC